jgi:hypothetical protein
MCTRPRGIKLEILKEAKAQLEAFDVDELERKINQYALYLFTGLQRDTIISDTSVAAGSNTSRPLLRTRRFILFMNKALVPTLFPSSSSMAGRVCEIEIVNWCRLCFNGRWP